MTGFQMSMLCFAVTLFLQIRNLTVFLMLESFLFSSREELEMLDRLPHQMSIVFNPIHWHRWTKGQWVAYANRVTKK